MVSLPAFAAPEDFTDAQAIGAWTGCVQQPGYALYPIRLEPTWYGFKVDYPGLCSGHHSKIGALSSTDAVEAISENVEACVEITRVSYRLETGSLSLVYIYADDHLATATLVQGSKVANCSRTEAIS